MVFAQIGTWPLTSFNCRGGTLFIINCGRFALITEGGGIIFSLFLST